jgi:NTE family protein
VTTRALVLGGGGIAGIAWEIGLLSGLAEAGVDLAEADLVVGTSAGSIVGTLLRTGPALAELYERQLGPVPPTEKRVDFDGTAMMTAIGTALAGVSDPQEARARVGGLALEAATMPEEERRAVIGARIGEPAWPDRRLVVTAVDAHDGSFSAFDAGSGVALLDAVAASCAVPMVYPPITIGERRYEKVLIVAPFPGTPGSPLGPSADDEVAELRKTADVHVVLADETALAAFGTNPLDPATREPSARAGRAQAGAVVEAVREFWG